VRRIDLTSGVINTFAGDGVPDFAGDGGLATLASLSGPQGVAEDTAGNLYIADTNNSRIRKVGAAVPPAITSPATASGTMGQVFTPYLVTATGHPPPRITVSNLPQGLSLSGAVISGVPAVSGAVDVTLTAQNSVGSAQLVLRIVLALPAGAASAAPFFTGTPPVFIFATPDPAVAGATVNFIAPTASDTDADMLAYTWDFGDPNAPGTATGALAAHVYSAPGIYTVSVTVTDGPNNIVSSMPLAVNDPSVTQQMIISRAQLKLNFLKANSDQLTVSGTIPLRDKFTPGGKTASFYFGNLTRTFTLNSNGSNTSKTDIFKVVARQKAGVFIDPAKQFFSGTFSVTLKKQTLQPEVGPLGFVANVSNAVPIAVPVIVSVNGDSYVQSITFSYSSSSKSGSAVKVASGSVLGQRSRK
jgi:PKD repeat protein